MNFDRDLARLIDHTILKADAVRAEVAKVCEEALAFEFASVCVNGFWVPLVAEYLNESPVKVCTVVGFPLGAMSTAAKEAETRLLIARGAQEIDMVINIGALRDGESAIVEQDIRAVVDASHAGAAIVKVIIETALLTDEQKIVACEIAKSAGADFVKTSTGFSTSGATVEDIALMRQTVGLTMGVKASGGVRTIEDLRAVVAAGANRVGASASVRMMEASGT